jgi:hypothetical protein
MLNDNAKKWVAALRSEEYQQTQNKLHGSNGFCCLGVACDLYAKETGAAWEPITAAELHFYSLGPDVQTFLGNPDKLPKPVMEWLGVAHPNGSYKITDSYLNSLVALNDEFGRSFVEIAEVIESEPEGLFN